MGKATGRGRLVRHVCKGVQELAVDRNVVISAIRSEVGGNSIRTSKHEEDSGEITDNTEMRNDVVLNLVAHLSFREPRWHGLRIEHYVLRRIELTGRIRDEGLVAE